MTYNHHGLFNAKVIFVNEQLWYSSLELGNMGIHKGIRPNVSIIVWLEFDWFDWFVGYYGISTFEGYLMPNPLFM